MSTSARYSSQEQALRGRIGALKLHATHDATETTAAARATFLERFEREVDPDGVLSPEERQRRAGYARRAHFAKLAYASSRARSKKAAKKSAASDELAADSEVEAGGASRVPDGKQLEQ